MFGPTYAEVASVSRIFADPLMAHRNLGETFWTRDHRLHSEALLDAARPWSSGEQLLAYLAVDLWGGYVIPDGAPRFEITRAASALDVERRETVLEAIALRMGMEFDALRARAG